MIRDKGSILVVDDTSDSLRVLTSTLTAEGYTVQPADSGELALASIAANPPELILLDIRMPGMDGFEVCRRLKAQEYSRNIPVVFLSALSEVGDRVEGLKLGAVDFISKPFRKEELLARVETHLELARLRASLERRVAERTAELHEANRRLQEELDEHKRTLRTLRESEERFRHLADTVPAVIWLSDTRDFVVFVNKHGLSLSGRTLDQLKGHGWVHIIHPDDLPLMWNWRMQASRSSGSFQSEIRVQRADGEFRWMLSTIVARGARNRGYIGMMADITDLKRNQERMLANQKLESLGVLAQGVAHDVNNLLGTILSEADLASLDIPEDHPARGSLERIKTVALRDSEIVALLSAYAGSGKDAPVEPVNLSALVADTLRLLRNSVSRKAVVKTNLPPHLPAVWMNATQVRQIVMNLALNASEALSGGAGTITFTTSREAGESQQPGNDGYVRLEVSDTGCGMSEEVMARIFDPFFSTKSIGRGLGLAAVQGIVRSFGGVLRVHSTPGQGSTFEISFPCRQPQTVSGGRTFVQTG